MKTLLVIAFGCLGFLAESTRASHTQVSLLLGATSAPPGATVWAAVDLKMDPGWHTYWKNPGAAGQATEIKWQLPDALKAGDILWPLPEKLPPAEVTTYGYEKEVLLLVPVQIATKAMAGPLKIKAEVSWLECHDECIPCTTQVEATLNCDPTVTASPDLAKIEAWKAQTPVRISGDPSFSGWSAEWQTPSSGGVRSLRIEHTAGKGAAGMVYDTADFFPDASDTFEVQPATEMIPSTAQDLVLGKAVKADPGVWPKSISGTVIIQKGATRTGYELSLPIAEPTDTAVVASRPTPEAGAGEAPVAGAAQSVWRMLLFAFIGGLILNIMPCVLPVIALKILGFVSEAKSEPRHVRMLGMAYVGGVLVSFLGLAAVVISVKAAGHRAGWGMQFGNPVFIVCLITVVTLVAMNLFGVFEVILGGRTMDAAGQLAARQGLPGAFFNGVLATTLATPCTAPFLAPALGFAFAQSASVIILVFITVGLGLASPYLLLSWNPGWLKFLPKPGTWMQHFKIAMGFPMLATVVWLFNVAASSYGKKVLWLGLFLVCMAFAAWVYGEFVQRGRGSKVVALTLVLALVGGGYFFALEKELNWRTVVPVMAGSLKESADGIDWQEWNPQSVARAQAEGKTVLVDFTADWCLTCQVNKKTSLDIASVREKMKQLDTVAFLADYTHFADSITSELQHYNRAGVPLVLVYPRRAGSSPIVMPEVLTPTAVLAALDQAGR